MFTVVPGGPSPCGGVVRPPNYNAITGNWNLKGNSTLQAPSFSISLSGDYVIPTEFGDFDLHLLWSHSSRYYLDVDNGLGQVAPSSPTDTQQKPIDLVNGSVGWTSNDKNWNARFWVKNLTDAQYYSYASESALLNFYAASPPRTFGVTVSRHF